MQVAEMMKRYREQLATIYDQREARAISGIVFEKLLQLEGHQLAFEKARVLTHHQHEQLESTLVRLVQHEPVQYVLGEADFCGLKFLVNNSVLIPRPETEELVQWVAEHAKGLEAPLILDIGTGSGCIAVSLAKKIPAAHVAACDISEEALKVAQSNAALNQVSAEFFHLDILHEMLTADAYDVIVSNPPYINRREAETLSANVLQHEPHLALFAEGEDDLVFYRAIGSAAHKALRKGGRLFFEIHAERGAEVEEILKGCGFQNIEMKRDLSGKDRMVSGKNS